MSIEDQQDESIAPNIPGLGITSLEQDISSIAPPDSQSQSVVERKAGPSAERSLAENNVLRVKLCGVCNEKPSKYKCARCYLPYCSVVCSTLHKATHPAVEPTPTPKPEPVVTSQPKDAPRPGTLAAAGYKGPFAALEDSVELQTLFKLYPNLPSQLDNINSVTLQPVDREENNGQSQYQWDSGKGRGGRKSQPWNQDQGLQRGVQALTKAKRAYGKDGEGIREFSKLVLQTVSRDTTIDAEAIIQREVAEENARIVSQLLNGEL